MLDAGFALAEGTFAAVAISGKRGLLDGWGSLANDGVVLGMGVMNFSVGGRAITLATVHNPFGHS
jgi:hypothetical protein